MDSIPPHNMSKSADFLEREEYNNSAVFIIKKYYKMIRLFKISHRIQNNVAAKYPRQLNIHKIIKE